MKRNITNNFNMSTTGVNLEVNLHKDIDSGAFYFYDSFKRIGDRKFVYTDCGNLSGEFDDNAEYDIIETRGYCQGDYAEVYVNIEEFESVTGAEYNSGLLKQKIDNLFWDTPLCFKVYIDTDIVYYSDLDGSYDIDAYDKQKEINSIIEFVNKYYSERNINLEVLKNELDKLLPEDLYGLEYL
jgi:hypothetical protein